MKWMVGFFLAGLACGSDSEDSTAICDPIQDKCDLPVGEDSDFCEMRRQDAFNPNQYSFQTDFIRWSCDDVNGVTEEDRGQEYCEYFAIVALPTAPQSPQVLGRNLGADYTFGTTPTKIELSFEDVTALENASTEVIGQCVFTSWNSDETAEVDCGPDCNVVGVPVKAENFRMHFEVNSTEAAQLLVQDCLAVPRGGNPLDQDHPFHDDFTRGCMHNAEINGTTFRKSDSDVCAATIRLNECECSVQNADWPHLISPEGRRGFPLGTWSDPEALPVGCHYVDVGDGSRTIVTCDLTATDVLDYSIDLKTRCQSKYADNVVVHVPLPDPSKVECSPDESRSPYSSTCSEQPWVLTP